MLTWCENTLTSAGTSVTGKNHRKRQTKRNSALSLPTCTHRKSGKPLFRQWHHAFEGRYTSPFHPPKIFTQQGGTEERMGHTRSRGTPCLNCFKKIVGNWQANTTHKGSPLTFLLLPLSHHIPLLSCHSPSTAREKLRCCDSSTRELLWHCEHGERGEPSDSELPARIPHFSDRPSHACDRQLVDRAVRR